MSTIAPATPTGRQVRYISPTLVPLTQPSAHFYTLIGQPARAHLSFVISSLVGYFVGRLSRSLYPNAHMMLSRTSTSSSLSVPDHYKRPLQTLLPTDSKVIATASARVYHLPFGGRPENWCYSGLAGTLVFGRNRTTIYADRKLGKGPGTSFDQVFWFRLIDPEKGLVWMHEIPGTFDYSLDKPFFHTFSGKSRMFGFRFDDDDEAAKLLKKIVSHIPLKASTPKKPKRFEQFASMTRRFTPSMVSPPATGTFVHLGHVGFNSRGQIETSDDVEPGWTMMLEELQGGYGVSKSKSLGGSDRDFVQGFLAGTKAAPLVAAETRTGPVIPPPLSRKSSRGPPHRKPTVKFA